LLWIDKFCKFPENFNPLNLPGEVEKVAPMIVIQILINKTYSQWASLLIGFFFEYIKT